MGFQNRGCEYRRKTDEKKLGCFHCGFYAGNNVPKSSDLIRSMLEQFRVGFAYGASTREQFEVIEFLSDGSFLNDEEVPETREERDFLIPSRKRHT